MSFCFFHQPRFPLCTRDAPKVSVCCEQCDQTASTTLTRAGEQEGCLGCVPHTFTSCLEVLIAVVLYMCEGSHCLSAHEGRVERHVNCTRSVCGHTYTQANTFSLIHTYCMSTYVCVYILVCMYMHVRMYTWEHLLIIVDA